MKPGISPACSPPMRSPPCVQPPVRAIPGEIGWGDEAWHQSRLQQVAQLLVICDDEDRCRDAGRGGEVACSE